MGEPHLLGTAREYVGAGQVRQGEPQLGLLANPRRDRTGVGQTTVSRILRREGVKPAPEGPWPWSTFIKATWGECAAADFFTTEMWTPRGLATLPTLFAIDLATRRVHI